MLAEFRLDYNQRHFVRNETFKKAAEGIEVCFSARLVPCASRLASCCDLSRPATLRTAVR